MFQDLRFGLRMLVRSPVYTSIAIITLALGIGATTAIFTLINAALLSRLPFPASEQLVQLANHEAGVNASRTVSYPDFEDWRAQAGSFEGMAAKGGVRLVFTAPNEGMDVGAESRVGEYVSPDYFTLLGVALLLGRTFLPEEAATNTGVHSVIVLSEWYTRVDRSGDWRGCDPRAGAVDAAAAVRRQRGGPADVRRCCAAGERRGARGCLPARAARREGRSHDCAATGLAR